MVESVVPIVLAAATGFSVLISRLHSRVSELDHRVDKFELRVAENYVSKESFQSALERVESHMIRIEQKLDKITS
jgi:hypothetical protein